ncbi:MAG TPA: sulfurtransferase-like selenium metabolism protein YedF [candidate division Zixibacteria bacterium]|nr:sulfurtransferase-like selenium metabolism protein YedF [candidate division Zixibacteria bacterium]
MTVDKDLLLLIKSDGLGDGEPDLGAKLMNAFLNMLYESGRLPALVICMNSGIFLTTEGSPVIETLRKFADAGTEFSSCGTCLDYYGRKDKLLIGKAGNMRETVAAMLSFKQILVP